jgi:hypothetical protein
MKSMKGQYYRVDLDLSALAGQEVKIHPEGVGKRLTQARLCPSGWLQKIIRQGMPNCHAKQQTHTSTPTATSTATPTATHTSTPTPTDTATVTPHSHRYRNAHTDSLKQ